MPDARTRLLALLSYVVLGMFVVGSALFEPYTVAGKGVDLPGTVWIHWWVRTTFEAFSLPISTDLLFYPDGKNFFNDTGANFIDAYLSIPLQWIFGVPDFIDALDVIVLAGNGLAMQALASDLTDRKHPAAAWAAAAAFTVNPYTIQQIAEGRPTQALLWFGVLATRHLIRIPTGTWRDAVLFGVFTVLQGLTYWFMVYFLTLALLPVALVALARSPKVVLPRLALAVGVALALAAPFLFGIARQIDAGAVTRLSFASWEDGPASLKTRWQLVYALLVSTAGIASLALVAAGGRRALPWLAGVALTVLFGVGARVGLSGDGVWENPLFITAWEHVPMVSRLGFPERATSMTFVLLGMGAAVGLARLDAVWSWLYALVVVGELFWRGTLPVPDSNYAIPPGNIRIKEVGGAVIYLPFGANEDAMIYQTFHGQPLFGGMGEREADLRPKGYETRLQNTFIAMLAGTLNDTDTPIAYTREDRATIAADFRWVWFDRRFGPASWTAIGYHREGKYRRLVRELGEPVDGDSNYAMWDLQAPVPADAPGLGPDAKRNGHELQRLENTMAIPSDTPPLQRAVPAQVPLP